MNKAENTKKTLQYRMRAIHRVLGFLAFGMTVVYALSGITLIHRTGDFMKKSTPVEMTLAAELNADQLQAELKMKQFRVLNESEQTIYFQDGQYDKTTGHVAYLKKEVIEPLNSFIQLHKLPDAKNRAVACFTTAFGITLFLLAATSLFMFKPGTKTFKRGLLYTIIGIILVVILILVL